MTARLSPPLRTIGLTGLGLLGRGIAACLLGHGFDVVAVMAGGEDRPAVRRQIDRAIAELVTRAGFPPELEARWTDRYHEAEAYEALTDCDFVIESVIEDFAIKQQVFDRIEAVVRPDTPIASNTSSYPITSLQRRRTHPERFLGMHWAEPAHVTRFLELVGGERTSPAALDTAVRLGRLGGKDPVVVRKDVPAFIANRLAYAMYREALSLLTAGLADVEAIDRAFRNSIGLWATLCGPFRWMDLTGGPATYARAMADVFPTLSAASAPPAAIDALREAGARGIADGRGFYSYDAAEAEAWEARLRDHAWTVRAVLDRYFPLDALEADTASGQSSGTHDA